VSPNIPWPATAGPRAGGAIIGKLQALERESRVARWVGWVGGCSKGLADSGAAVRIVGL